MVLVKGLHKVDGCFSKRWSYITDYFRRMQGIDFIQNSEEIQGFLHFKCYWKKYVCHNKI